MEIICKVGMLLSVTLLIGNCGMRNEQANSNKGSIAALCSPGRNGLHSRWISPEDPKGEKEKGGGMGKGAKGNTFHIVQLGRSQILFAGNRAGIINRMWPSATIDVRMESGLLSFRNLIRNEKQIKNI